MNKSKKNGSGCFINVFAIFIITTYVTVGLTIVMPRLINAVGMAWAIAIFAIGIVLIIALIIFYFVNSAINKNQKRKRKK